MKKFLLITTLTISLIIFVLFSDIANEASKPYLSKLIESKIDENVSIEVEEYKLDYNYITILAKVNQDSNIKIYGRFNVIEQNCDINYTVESIDRLVKIKDIVIPPNTNIHGNIQSKLNGTNASIDGEMISSLANLVLKNGTVNLESKRLLSEFTLNIKELKKLKFVTKKDLRGALQITGEIEKKEKELRVSGTTHNFDGEINFTLINDDIEADMKKVSVEKIFTTLNYPHIFYAPLSGKLLYNIKTKEGKIDSTLSDGKIIKSELTELVQKYTRFDLTKETYNETRFNAKLHPKTMEFKFISKSKRNIISLYDAKIKNSGKKIYAKYKIEIDGKNLNGKISGDIDSPRVSIDGSQFIEKEVQNVIEKYINIEDSSIDKLKDKLEEFGLKREDSDKAIDKATNFLKGFF